MSLIKLLLAISFQVSLAKTLYKYSWECVKVIETFEMRMQTKE